MQIQSYDAMTGHSFSWNGEIFYQGKLASAPSDALTGEPSDNHLSEMTGCYFLSGLRNTAYVYWSDGKARFVTLVKGTSTTRNPILCLCGPICAKPDLLMEQFGDLLGTSIYICPLQEELRAFGILAQELIKGLCKPRKIPLYDKNYDLIPGREHLDFQDNLDGDCIGRLAQVVGSGIPVINEIRKSIGVSPFYGKVLVKNTMTFGKPVSFVISISAVDRYFPKMPITSRYMAATVSVQVRNTDAFREASGDNSEFVNIHLATDSDPDLRLFLEYLNIFGKQEFAAAYERKTFPMENKLPVIRYNRGYIMKQVENDAE